MFSGLDVTRWRSAGALATRTATRITTTGRACGRRRARVDRHAVMGPLPAPPLPSVVTDVPGRTGRRAGCGAPGGRGPGDASRKGTKGAPADRVNRRTGYRLGMVNGRRADQTA